LFWQSGSHLGEVESSIENLPCGVNEMDQDANGATLDDPRAASGSPIEKKGFGLIA
jgi:hypothetical protein